jgi:hypothetical protein
MEIQEGNKLIAEFLGWAKDANGFWSGCNNGIHYKLTFDCSWNELMPVVSKCYSLCNDDKYPDEEVTLSEALLSCDINELFAAVIQFITWYNEQNPQQ